MDFEQEYNSPEYCKALIEKIETHLNTIGREVRFMEVCGTHTASLFHSGLRSLLPKGLHHISGPGCPVCVTHEDEVETFLNLAKLDNVIIATFGDLIRVPNVEGTSLKNSTFGVNSRLEIIYSPEDAIKLAHENTEHEIIFLGIGFETTAPIIAATILSAKAQNLKNFSVYSMHKQVAPALYALLTEEDEVDVPSIDIFLLPGHVACITGIKYFDFIAEKYNKPAIVSGFESLDMAYSLERALLQLVEMKENPQMQAKVENAYTRVVKQEGNPKAMELLYSVFQSEDAYWRGLGLIPQSGLAIRPEFAEFNALLRLNIERKHASKPSACRCGSVLKGHIQPPECPIFAKACTPQKALGPCMVSTEGACASYYRYMGL